MVRGGGKERMAPATLTTIVTLRSTAAYRATHLHDDDVAVFRGDAIFHIVVTEEVVQRPERRKLGNEHDVRVGTVHADKPHEVWVAAKPEQDIRLGAKGRRQDLGGRDHGGTRRSRDPELGAVHDLERAAADFLEDADVPAVNLLAECFAKLFDAVPQGVVWNEALAVQHHVARWARGMVSEPVPLWGFRVQGSHGSQRSCVSPVRDTRKTLNPFSFTVVNPFCGRRRGTLPGQAGQLIEDDSNGAAGKRGCQSVRAVNTRTAGVQVRVCVWWHTTHVPLLDGFAFKSMAVYGAHGVVHKVV